MNHNAAHLQRPLRIAFLDHTAKLGGAELSLLNMLERLDRDRFVPIVVLGESGPLARRLAAAGVDTCVLPLSPEVAEAKKDQLGTSSLLKVKAVWKTIQYAWRVSRLIKARNVDLIHTNSLKADIIGGLCARATGLPLVWHIHDRLEGDYLPRVVAAALRLLCRWVPDFVVANSQSTLKSLRLPNSERSTVIFEGIPAATLPYPAAMPRVDCQEGTDAKPRTQLDLERRQSGLPECSGNEKPVTIGIVGRLTRWKGQHILIEAASLVRRRFPNARFQIIGSAMFGESRYEAKLKQQVSELGLQDCVEFLGFRDDVAGLIGDLDILVHASILEEPFGRVITEGMLGGKPVVATRGGGVPEIVMDGVTGLLVAMGDVTGMANAVCRLLANPALRAKMGSAGRQRVIAHFTTEQTVPQMESVFERICGGGSRGKNMESLEYSAKANHPEAVARMG